MNKLNPMGDFGGSCDRAGRSLGSGLSILVKVSSNSNIMRADRVGVKNAKSTTESVQDIDLK
jgi:hypothetical protein